MDNTDPNTMNRLKSKVADNGGTVLFDLQFLLGFAYVGTSTTKDTITDLLYQLHHAPGYL
jgi:hypothetical protein